MLSFDIEWRVPVGCGFSGFFTEVALGFVPALHERGLAVKLLTGGCDEAWLKANLEPADADAFRTSWTDEHKRNVAETSSALAVEHGEPCGMRRWHSAVVRPWRVVARTMTESALKADQASCLRHADEIWVPTAWHVDTFVAAGIARSSLHVVPEPVDVDFFAPTIEQQKRRALRGSKSGSAAAPFVFLSSFKWEHRKGWDLLLEAYWSEFAADERQSVRLLIKTYLPSWEPGPRDLNTWVARFAEQKLHKARKALAPVELRVSDVSRAALRELYAASDAFVLPTRGEGWGLPIAEAMSMGLPAIATNFSGPTAFLSAQNSHPLPVARHLPGGFAEPSVAALRRAMRRAFEEHRDGEGEAAAQRGARARADMVAHFSRAAVADVVLRRLHALNASRAERTPERTPGRGGAGRARGAVRDELRRLRARWPPAGSQVMASDGG